MNPPMSASDAQRKTWGVRGTVARQAQSVRGTTIAFCKRALAAFSLPMSASDALRKTWGVRGTVVLHRQTLTALRLSTCYARQHRWRVLALLSGAS